MEICVISKLTSFCFNFRLIETVITCPTLIIPFKGILLTSLCGNAYGSNCVFGCESGYGSLDGNVTRTCLESGLWSGENISCTGTGTSLRFYLCIKLRQTTKRVTKQTTISSNTKKKITNKQNISSYKLHKSFDKGLPSVHNKQ